MIAALHWLSWVKVRLLVAASGMTVLCGLAIAADGFQLPLEVQEPGGVQRTAWPVSGGLPLPKGLVAKWQPELFALFRSDGNEIPCQITPLVVEPDGRVSWILVDFQDDFAPGATNRYVLRLRKPAAKTDWPLKVAEGDDGVQLDTGRIRLSISKKQPFGLFQRVEADGKPVVVGGTVSYVQLQGRSAWNDKSPWQSKHYVAAPPEVVRLWYAGPMRATIEVRGRFADDPCAAGYQAWITAWAGKSYVWVKYKLCNSNPEQYTAILVERSAVELNLAQGGDVRVGAATSLECGTEGWIHQGLLLRAGQPEAAAVLAGSGDKILWTGKTAKDRPGGWLVAGGAPRVFVCDRLFASNPARRLAAGKGKLVLEGIAKRFDGPIDPRSSPPRPTGQPWRSAGMWLYDCSHHSSEYFIDFAAPATDYSQLAAAARNRLWAFAPPEYYSQCEAVGIRFGTLEDEKTAYSKWGWIYQPKQVPSKSQPDADAFVPWEDNHYESEADSVQGLLWMYLRTGQRGWFDQAEAWARYHADLQAWRTDGWAWKDGAIWFPTGGPQGNRPVRKKWNFQWGPDWGDRAGNPDCYDLWRHAQAKSCYCHFYGSGLADYFCLTGDRDALEAALDNVEQKDNEFRYFRNFTPGKSDIGETRGFGRGWEVIQRVLLADPGNKMIQELCHLAAQTLWQSPMLDERGFHPSCIGAGFGGMRAKEITPKIKQWMDQNGITFTTKGEHIDTLSKGGRTWPVKCMGGTWQHIYVHNGADLYAKYFDDEDIRDFVIAFAQFSARYMLSPKCHQTWYYTYFDVPDLGMVFDPWAFEHTDTKDGEGCIHSGWYTRFYPDACAKGYALTGELPLLDKARQFWYYGSKREYQTKGLRGGPNEVNIFATHVPPKDDTVLETARLFYEAAHPRADTQPPEAVKDLKVRLLGDGRAEVSFTAPADRGGGKVVRYQLKAAELPIVPYEQWDYARDLGKRRNWWRAVNCRGEPAPSAPGKQERFVVSRVPQAEKLYFAVRSIDDSSNLSPISNLATAP